MLTEEQKAEIQGRIDKLEAALDDLAMGKSVQSVGIDGRTAAYTPGSEPKIKRRIAELNAKLGNRSRKVLMPRF